MKNSAILLKCPLLILNTGVFTMRCYSHLRWIIYRVISISIGNRSSDHEFERTVIIGQFCTLQSILFAAPNGHNFPYQALITSAHATKIRTVMHLYALLAYSVQNDAYKRINPFTICHVALIVCCYQTAKARTLRVCIVCHVHHEVQDCKFALQRSHAVGHSSTPAWSSNCFQITEISFIRTNTVLFCWPANESVLAWWFRNKSACLITDQTLKTDLSLSKDGRLWLINISGLTLII